MKFFREYVGVLAVLLEFYVACDRRCHRYLPIICDFNRQDEKTPSTADDSGRGREAAGAHGAQIMNGQIGGGNAFIEFQLSEDRKGSGRIDQRGDRAAVNYALVLSQFVANFQMNADFAPAYLAKFETE
jgi:hypothetical protein